MKATAAGRPISAPFRYLVRRSIAAGGQLVVEGLSADIGKHGELIIIAMDHHLVIAPGEWLSIVERPIGEATA